MKTKVEETWFEEIVEMLEALEQADRGNARLAKLAELDCPLLRKTLQYATSPYITFGIKKLPEYQLPDAEMHLLWTEIEGCLDALATRDLTGNDAKEAVAELFRTSTSVEAKWLERILRQDLRLDLASSSINQALPGCIPVFKLALGIDFRKVKPKDLQGRWVVQPKYDGGRCVAYLPRDGGQVTLLSRTGKPWYNFESIRQVMQQYNIDCPVDHDRYVDGEAISIVDGAIDFQAIQKTMHAKSRATEIGQLKFFVFDAAPGDEWETPTWPYLKRLQYARTVVDELNGMTTGPMMIDEQMIIQEPNMDAQVVHAAPSGITENPSPDVLVEICQAYVEAGFEGAIIRKADVPVQMKKGKALLKVKTFQDAEAEILGVIEGEGKYVGMLGALHCRLPSGKEFDMGSGISDEQRVIFWSIFKYPTSTVKPKFVTIKFFELTDDGIPRFPIFKGFRDEQDIGERDDG